MIDPTAIVLSEMERSVMARGLMEGWNFVRRLAGDMDHVIPGHDLKVCALYPRASDTVDAFALHLPPAQSVS
jgi:hypothetical protein